MAALDPARSESLFVARSETAAADAARVAPAAASAPARRTQGASLAAAALTVRFQGLTALANVDLTIVPGQVLGLIGPNGTGKTTLVNCLTGFQFPVAGRVLLDGRDATGWRPERLRKAGVARTFQAGRLFRSLRFTGQDLVGMRPEQIARRGLSLVPEGRHVFSTLTVEENLRLGTFMRGRAAQAAERLDRILGYFPRLRERRSAPAGGLSGGEQQMLVISRALKPATQLVMVDEPSLGLAPKIVDQVYEILLDLRRGDGLTLLIDEQSSQRVLRWADRVYVLRNGAAQLADRASNLQDGEAIMHAYFGFREAARAGAPA
jgi:branched-chain amino acid transport system ATP-binding protein